MRYRAPDRRRHVRLLTLKNFGRVVVAAVVLLVAANLLSEARRTSEGSFGRLFGREMRKSESVPPTRRIEVVTEAPAANRDTAGTLLNAPAAREQYLAEGGVDSTSPAEAIGPRQPQDTTGTHITITGDGSGVSVVSGATRRLSGGFGR